MFKNIKKWSAKKKIVVSIAVVVLLALIISVIYANFKPDPLPVYQSAKAEKGELQATFDTQGLVVSDSTEAFQAASGVKVLTVNVAVGDKVKAGQVLATFDVAPLKAQMQAYQSAADKAKASYDKANANNQNAKKQLSEIQKEMPKLQKQIDALNKEISAQEKALQDKKDEAVWTESDIKALMEKLKKEGITEEEVANLLKSLKNGKGDLQSNLKETVAAKKLELTQCQAQLSSLEAQKPLYEAQTDTTMTDLYKSVMEQKNKEKDAYFAVVDGLKKGWTAQADGVITEIQIQAGQVFTPQASGNPTVDMQKLMSMASGDADAAEILSEIFNTTAGADKAVAAGMVLESYGDFYAEFTVGKYDLPNLKVGQKATVTSLDKTYDAVVTYVSATANAQAGFDISSIASTITGGSSASANSAPIRVKILNPDEKIVLGFDVDVKINTERMENVLKIPVEAVTTPDGENCVFVYNPEEKTVEKRSVSLGVATDTHYEVLEGLKQGEQVILNPKTLLQDGDKVEIKA